MKRVEGQYPMRKEREKTRNEVKNVLKVLNHDNDSPHWEPKITTEKSQNTISRQYEILSQDR